MGKTTNDEELIDKQNLTMEPADPPDEKKDGDIEVPQYKEKVDLTDGQINRLREEIFAYWETLKNERKEHGLENKWDGLEAQYDGEMVDNLGQEFSLGVPVTKVKVDTVSRLAVKSFCDSDPKFEVTAKPESIREGREEIAERQGEYLDYIFDEDIDIRGPLRRVIHQASNLDVGLMKIPYEYRTKRRKREEHYSGKSETDPITKVAVKSGLLAFEQEYPQSKDAGSAYHTFWQQLNSGKDVDILVDFDEVVYNNPKPYFVDIRDFWVSTDTEGYEGLCNSEISIELQRYSWFDLKKKEQDNDLENVDKVRYGEMKDGKIQGEPQKGYEYKKHEIIEVTYWFNMGKGGKSDTNSGEPEDAVRIVCWFSVLSKSFLGAIYYPYYRVDSIYVPFYIKDKKPGFYKGGMSEDLTNSNLAQNAMLNFMLTDLWIRNTITPIVREGSTIAQQFLEKRWTHGIPIEVPEDVESLKSDLGFLEKPMSANPAEILNTLLFLAKMDDDMTGISALKTGRESPQDPNAPASKVAMLLKETGINIEDYVQCLLPSFNKIGEIVLQLTFQMSKSGRMYKQKQRANEVAGRVPPTQQDIFSTIKPDEMGAKTVISSRAASFAFDKVQEKNENLTLFQALRTEPAVVNNPQAIYMIIRTLIKSWSPMWKAKVDQVWPSPEQYNAQQMKIVMSGLETYAHQLDQQRQLGVQAPVKLEDFLAIVQQMQTALMTPPPDKMAKQ